MEAFVYAAWDLRTDMNDLVFRVFDPLLARLFVRFKNKLHLHTYRVSFDDNEVTEIRKVDPIKKQVCSILDYPRERLSIHRIIPLMCIMNLTTRVINLMVIIKLIVMKIHKVKRITIR
jgi:hypothetical protein